MATEKFANNASTTLNGDISDVSTSLVVTSASTFPTTPQFRIKIGNEILLVTGVSGTTYTVTRGQEGTTAASHLDTSVVTHVLTAAALSQFQTDIQSQSRWMTALDLDFTSLGSIALGSDGAYSLGSTSWNKINSAQDYTAASVSTADGFSVTPTNSPLTNYNPSDPLRNLPAITLDLAQVIPSFNPTMGVRIWVYNSSISPVNENYQMATIAIDPGNLTYSAVSMRRGFNGNTTIMVSASVGTTEYAIFNTQSSIGSTNDVVVLELDRIGSPVLYTYYGSYSSGWPLFTNLVPLRNPVPLNWNAASLTHSNALLLLGGFAVTATPPTMKFKRVKIEYWSR
jgi:hypothetical protein